MDKPFENIKIIDYFPTEINRKPVLGIAFEPKGTFMGDFFHIGFLYLPKLDFNEFEYLSDILHQMPKDNLTVRIHSKCFLGDAMHSSDCDCNLQLNKSWDLIFEKDYGLLIYLRQEGRGIGLRKKIRCLALQKGYLNGRFTGKTYSSDEANLFFNERIDNRTYEIAADFLQFLKISGINLITGNAEKVKAIENKGITVRHEPNLLKISERLLSTRAVAEIHEKIARGYSYNFE
jgi:GTP cyclohydrolase II